MGLKEEIYANLRKVPHGKVVTYGILGNSVGINAPRFVGTCMKTNPDPDKTPCYKVVKSSGEVGGYSSVGGVNEKIKKLEMDGIEVIDGKVDLVKYGYNFM